ncbi:hypothetical protein [Dyadobacter luticola]|uniref:SGNH/GDSL hydrolase family protein n=1 Tax=Dyadobacter luticola TaxID=1979387 RepID=A0A5R9KSR9_9BACT|nr:hypothetical protein [Dyadobacter luticola]TLU99136.1 hypothetical protein FEN17_21400 [Dyadobacter luticola]
MNLRVVLFSSIFFLILFLLTELLLRLSLLFLGYPFLKPADNIFKSYYTNLDPIRKKEIKSDDEIYDVLILGGSVVSTPWSNLEARLDTLLRNEYKGKKFAFYNIAGAGHTSLDNYLKYKLLKDQRFDLVLYYEAINENRANNIPAKDFRNDYSHIKWYNDIYLLESHPEINFTVIPYLVDRTIHYIKDKVTHKVYVSQEKVDPQFAQYGSDIKTAGSYGKNLEGLVRIAKERGDKLVLMSYATYFPPNVKLTGEQVDMSHFAGCMFASPVTIWGKPDNVKKGVQTHNLVLRKVVKDSQVAFLDMEALMPKDSTMFCDVCHVAEPGAQRFAREVSGFIIREKMVQ